MSPRALKLAIVISGALLIAFQVKAKSRPTPEEIRARARGISGPAEWRGRTAPDFELTMLDGSTFRVSDQVGRKIIILNFFATWCGPCRSEMPELERFQRARAADGVVLIGVDVQEKDEIVKEFAQSLNLSFPIGVDGAGDISGRYDVDSYPTTIVIGADGKVKQYDTGAIANADVALAPVIAAEAAELRAGHGITAAAYKAALAAEPKTPSASSSGDDAPLEGRAKRIADTMPCPCGCPDKVSACGCSTSKGIKARLARGGYDAKTDVEVMQELNKEFCMKPM